VIKNWEGDWQLQENFDINAVPTPERIREFIDWMQARQAGVTQGRAAGAVADFIQHAIEFNLLSHSVRDSAGVLHDVVRSVPSDLISYSAWETSNQFDTRRMKDAITFIERVPGNQSRKVLIGEFGLFNNPPDPNAGTHTDSLLRAFLDMDVDAFFWEIFNSGAPTGLIGPGFQRFDTWFALRQALGARNNATVVRDPALTNVPATMDAGQAISLTVSFTNTGEPWYQSVGYQIELIGPDSADLGGQAWLPHDVNRSGMATFVFDFAAPTEPGMYHFQMTQLGIEVFGEAVAFEVRTPS